jgi:hypothetical protein
LWIHLTPEILKRPDPETISFRKTVVHVGDHEKQFFRVIICCAFRKLSGALGSFLPGTIKRRPPTGLHKETILMAFLGYFQCSHRSLRDQRKSLHAESAHSWCPPKSEAAGSPPAKLTFFQHEAVYEGWKVPGRSRKPPHRGHALMLSASIRLDQKYRAIE